MHTLLAFTAPSVDLHALAPEIVVVGVLVVVLLLDLVTDETPAIVPTLAGFGLLAAVVPVVTLATSGETRAMFEGGYVVDNFALVLKALFLLAGYVVILLSTNYIGEGDYWEGEYYALILSSVLGMMVMASSRDLIGIFIALELLSIPAYMLAAWRKRDLRSDEAGMKYYLMGVFASAILLYGMSLLYGLSGTTNLAGIAASVGREEAIPMISLAIVFVLVGFGFKVSAVPFHTWAPDTYEGAPTPVTAFLAVLSKAAGFVALLLMVLIAFRGHDDIYQPLLWFLSAATMIVGNLIALRQTNVVRMLAYSGIAQAGYMLAPLAVSGYAGVGERALHAVLGYLLIYAAMNLGAFAVVIAVARKTRSGEIKSFGGLMTYAPGLAALMTFFLASLAGIPPFGGWFAKFGIFTTLISADNWAGYSLALLVAVNSVVAAFYYGRLIRVMISDPVPDGDTTPIRVPVSINAALVLTTIVTLAFGIYPTLVTHLSNSTSLFPG